MSEKKKIVLAYSGGLDTSIILAWLKENYKADVIAVCFDAGQADDFEAIEKKAYATGAEKAYVLDIKEEFVTNYIWSTLKSGAIYENDYLLGTAMARPLMGKCLVEIAEREGAYAIAHGCTGKGNDQVRFESAIHALNPSLEIIAPWRTWDFKSREELIDYAVAHNIHIDQSKENIYSRDQNLWHISHEGGELEDPWNLHSDDLFMMSVRMEDAPDAPTLVDIDFEKGIPVGINGQKLPPVDLLIELNRLGGENGVGTIDIVENRLVGMKSRGVYETPGGTILYRAHYALEKLIHDKDTLFFKNYLSQKYAQMVYDGQWFCPLRVALDKFNDSLSEEVTGTVKMKLYKGNAVPAASKSEFSLFNSEYATFGEDKVYEQSDAGGFINLFSLPMKIRALRDEELGIAKDKRRE
jgi:argininosuccinate synthase